MERLHGQRRGAKNYNPIICIPARWFGELSKTKSQTCLRTAGYHQESRHRRSRRRAATRDL